MKNKGFTLIEVLIGLCLLGLISMMVLPAIDFSSKSSSRYSEKMEMMYLGEMVIEKIKAFHGSEDEPVHIFQTNVEDIITSFQEEDDVEIILNSDDEYKDYEIKLSKKQKDHKLWKVFVLVYPVKEGARKNHVYYKALLPSK